MAGESKPSKSKPIPNRGEGSPSVRIGRYELVRRLDRGFLGPLWVMRFDHQGESLLAMGRVLELDDEIDADAREELSEAAWEALELQCEGVARCADVVFDNKGFALIDDFIEGQALSALYRLRSSQRVLFPVDVALRIAIDILEAVANIRDVSLDLGLAHCHGGIGPDTVLVGTDGVSRVLNPLVAGIATAHESFRLRPERAPYVAPEQWRDEEADERTDVYAVGCILWELLANRRIHVTSPATIQRAVLDGKLPALTAQEREGLNDPLRSAVDGALSSDQFERYDTARGLAEALRSTGVKVATHQAVADFVEGLAKAHLESQRKATENSTMAHIAEILRKERTKGTPGVGPAKKKRKNGVATGTRPSLGVDGVSEAVAVDTPKTAAVPKAAAAPQVAAVPSSAEQPHVAVTAQPKVTPQAQVTPRPKATATAQSGPKPEAEPQGALPSKVATSNSVSLPKVAVHTPDFAAKLRDAQQAPPEVSKDRRPQGEHPTTKQVGTKRGTHVSQPPPRGPLPIASIPLVPPPVPIAAQSPSTMPQPSRAKLPRRRGGRPEHQTLLGIAPPPAAMQPEANTQPEGKARMSQEALRERFAAKFGAKAAAAERVAEELPAQVGAPVEQISIEELGLENESVTRPYMDVSAADLAPVNRSAKHEHPPADEPSSRPPRLDQLAPAEHQVANDTDLGAPGRAQSEVEEPTHQWGSSEHRLLEQLRAAEPANEASDILGAASVDFDSAKTEVTPRPHVAASPKLGSGWPAITWFFAGSTVTLLVVVGALLVKSMLASNEAVPGPAATTAPIPVTTAPQLSAQPAVQPPASSSSEPLPPQEKAEPQAEPEAAARQVPTEDSVPLAGAEPDGQAAGDDQAASDAADAETAAGTSAPAASAAPLKKPVRRWSKKVKKSKKVGSGFIPSDL